MTPLLLDVATFEPGRTYLDLGCGDGRVMRVVASRKAFPIGIELSPALARIARHHGPVVVAELPSLAFLKTSSVDGAYCVLVLEHLSDEEAFFSEMARVVRPGGALALVINHPVWTAPDSTPITDTDGEVLWRPGGYFNRGESSVPAGNDIVAFQHRSMADLMNAASASGWSLAAMIEEPHHDLGDQPGIPRLLACRWQLLPSGNNP